MKRFFACAVALVASASVSFAQCPTCPKAQPVSAIIATPVQKFQQAVQSVTYGVKARVRDRAWFPRVRAFVGAGVKQ